MPSQAALKLIEDIASSGDPSVLFPGSPYLWATYSGLQLPSGPYKEEGHEYVKDIMECQAQRQCAMKGAQMTFTTIDVIRTIHGMIYNQYPQGCLYLFPTRDDVTDFSKGRFQPMISDNKFIKQHIKDTDAVNVKRIGKAFLYLRGARASQKIEGVKQTSSQLKSVPVDRIDFDELDEMNPKMVTLALERMAHSEVQEESYLSTPSIPGFGIDKLYQGSDQRIWQIKCKKCGVETCLELEFPNCLEDMGHTVLRVCRKCRNEIYPKDGRWEVQYPNRDMVGWWISQLNSAYVEPKTILDAYKDPPDGNITEVYNSKLGIAHIKAENQLTAHDFWNCLSREPERMSHPGPTAMGVDIGNTIYVVILDKPNEKTARFVYAARVSEWDDIHDIAKRFNVRSAVVDREPEIHKAREFQKAEPYEVHLCDYIYTLRGVTDWDPVTGMVKTNRTEICDATHEMVTANGRFILPRRNEEIDVFVKEACNIAKILVEDELGGRKYVYRKLGDDHYRHALNYGMMALSRVSVFKEATGHVLPASAYKRKHLTWETR